MREMEIKRMEMLRSDRLEISQPSEDGELLSRIQMGTVEYDLIRRVDLSYNRSDLTALQYRSYLRLCWSTRQESNQNGRQPTKDEYFVGLYNQQLANLYYFWAENYLNLTMRLEPSFNWQDVDGKEVLTNDFHKIQNSGLLMVTFKTDSEKIAQTFRERLSAEAYKERCFKVDWAAKQVEESHTDKAAAYLYQLSALRKFYDQCHSMIGEYHQSHSTNGNGRPESSPVDASSGSFHGSSNGHPEALLGIDAGNGHLTTGHYHNGYSEFQSFNAFDGNEYHSNGRHSSLLAN